MKPFFSLSTAAAFICLLGLASTEGRAQGGPAVAATNANGEFEFVVPATAGPLRAQVTYAGYADELITLNDGTAESTVNLANAVVIVIARKQRLKAYHKTARKQVRRSLRQLR